MEMTPGTFRAGQQLCLKLSVSDFLYGHAMAICMTLGM